MYIRTNRKGKKTSGYEKFQHIFGNLKVVEEELNYREEESYHLRAFIGKHLREIGKYSLEN